MDNIKTDYVTLWLPDAFNNDKSDMVNGLCVWDIPPESYFYKEKAMVTLMSVCDATLDERLDTNVIMMSPIGINSTTAQIDSATATKLASNLGCLGSFVSHSKVSNTQFFDIKYSGTSPIEVQVSPQPNEIRILFLTIDKVPVDLSDIDTGGRQGHICLKFQYFNQRQYEVSNSPF